MSLNNKAGQYTIGALGGLAIAMVVAAIIIAIGGNVLGDVQEQLSVDTWSYNQTISATGNVSTLLTQNIRLPNLIINTSVVVYNESGMTSSANANVTMDSACYNVEIANSTISFNEPAVTPDCTDMANSSASTYYVNYQITYLETSAYNATKGGLEGTNTFGDWLDTIALIIVAAVVIGIVVSSFKT